MRSNILLAIVVTLIVALGLFFWNDVKSGQARVLKRINETSIAKKKQVPRLSIIPYYDEYPNLGDDSAKVKMIVFVDYDCPYSIRFIQEQLPRLKEKYVDKGVLKIFMYDLPLNIHEDAFNLAVGVHGEFERVKDVSNAISNVRKKNNYLGNSIYSKSIIKSKEIAGIAGITSTPVFVINDRVLEGLRSIEEIESLISYSVSNTISQQHSPNTCSE